MTRWPKERPIRNVPTLAQYTGVSPTEVALRDAMTGPTSGGIARQLAPVVLDAIIAGKIPGIVWRPQ